MGEEETEWWHVRCVHAHLKICQRIREKDVTQSLFSFILRGYVAHIQLILYVTLCLFTFLISQIG